MAVIFNATTTTTGLQISSDSSGAFQFETNGANTVSISNTCLLYTSPSPRDGLLSRMPSSA